MAHGRRRKRKTPIARRAPCSWADRIALSISPMCSVASASLASTGKPRGEVPLPEPGSVAALAARNDGQELYLRFRLVPAAGHGFSAMTCERGALEPFYAAQVTVRRVALRDPSAVLQLQGRHPGPAVRDACARGRARRQPTRRSFTATADSTSPRYRGSRRRSPAGSSRAASTPWPTSAAAASTARSGTVPARANEAERLRRLHRRGRVPVREKYTTPSDSPSSGGSNGGLLVAASHDPAPEPVRRRIAGGWRPRHDALPQVFCRTVLGRRLRFIGRPGGLRSICWLIRRCTI